MRGGGKMTWNMGASFDRALDTDIAINFCPSSECVFGGLVNTSDCNECTRGKRFAQEDT